MASQTFSISSGADVQDTATVTLASGEIARVRFSTYTGGADAYLGIIRNAVTTYDPISVGDVDAGDERVTYYGPALSGDTVFVRVKLNGTVSTVAGILETVS